MCESTAAPAAGIDIVPAHNPVQVVGEGLLANTIAAVAAERGTVVRTEQCGPGCLVPPGSTLVVASDGWDVRAYPTAREVCAAAGVPWLAVRAELGRVVLGPAELPGARGCGCCAELRSGRARQNRAGHDAVWRTHGETIADRPSSWLTELAADLVAALVLDEASRLATDPDSARTLRALLCVELNTLRLTTHRFLPDPLCPECGDLPDDAASLADITLGPRPKARPDTYRVRTIGNEMDALEKTYVDAECGVVQTLTKGSEGGLITAAAPMGLRGGSTEFGIGRTRNYRHSRLVALLEALERWGGTQPSGKRTVVHAAYADVAGHALDPRTLGLYPPQRYRLPGFRFRPFTEATPCAWVWGYSFARAEPILVPETYAYYHVQHAGHEHAPFVYEISNGCALGGCLEEAILYGLLEVAERDAFLMTWYGRMSLPRINLDSARDRTLPLLAEAIQAETGYQVTAFDSTLEQGIPCVWVMAVHPGDDELKPKAVCAAGSHLDPERAVENALSELGPLLANFIRTYPEQREHAREMAADPALVRTMEQHHHLYGHPDVFGRLSFLTESTQVRDLSELARIPPNADLRDDLDELVSRYLDTDLDVIAVDQTTPEHRAGGLACAKVIIPGTLPMTFGHEFRRVDGLPRLYHVPHELGYRDRPLGPEDINPHPHPFP